MIDVREHRPALPGFRLHQFVQDVFLSSIMPRLPGLHDNNEPMYFLVLRSVFLHPSMSRLCKAPDCRSDRIRVNCSSLLSLYPVYEKTRTAHEHCKSHSAKGLHRNSRSG
jgi:hypothetical protein